MSSGWLRAEGFQLVSMLTLSANEPMRLSRWRDCEGGVAPLAAPSLYVFLDLAADTVLYVGKAGKGWSARRPQHNGGYSRAHRGLTSAAHQGRIAELRHLLECGAQVAVFERAVLSADVINEEEAKLIRRFCPPLNVKGKRG